MSATILSPRQPATFTASVAFFFVKSPSKKLFWNSPEPIFLSISSIVAAAGASPEVRKSARPRAKAVEEFPRHRFPPGKSSGRLFRSLSGEGAQTAPSP